MEKEISPKTEVAELELEAVIGFNGEESSKVSKMLNLGGLGTPGELICTQAWATLCLF